MNRFRATLIVGAVLALGTAATQAQQVVPAGENLVEVTVTAAGEDEDDAIRQAMRKAVETGAGTFISSYSEVKDFVLIRDTILARAAGFIQSHKVTSKRDLPDGTVEVTLVAVVSVQGVEDMWAAVTTLLQQMGRPKIMVFIREEIDNQVQDSSTVQTRIENLLLDSGFLLVDKSQLQAIDAKDLQAAAAEDSPARLQAVAKRFGAQLFISGTANASAGPPRNVSGIELFPYQAESNIRTYRSDTAQLLSSVPGSPTRGVDRVGRSAATKALDAQAQQVAPEVQLDILTFWQDVLAGRGEVQLHVEGVTFKQYAEIKKQLPVAVKEIKDVTGPFHNQVAELSLQSEVTASVLAEKLLDAMGEQLEITDVSQNVIKARYIGP